MKSLEYRELEMRITMLEKRLDFIDQKLQNQNDLLEQCLDVVRKYSISKQKAQSSIYQMASKQRRNKEK